MKGFINMGIQEMVSTRFGLDAWEEIKSLAGCDEPFFAASLDYPDDSTRALIGAVAKFADLAEKSVMVQFGAYFVSATMAETYPHYFALAGSSVREVLTNLNRIHREVTHGVADAQPPDFTVENLPDGRILLGYDSPRGLCAVVHGIVLGLGQRFNEQVKVREIACISNGDDGCVMEVSFS